MLKPETERVWSFLSRQPTLAGFILTGGSALALQMRHRLSEDLDFLWPDKRLPRSRLENFGRLAGESGFALSPADDPASLAEFADAGLELLDYQQDYLVNRLVKVSFFAPELPFIAVLEKMAPGPLPRLATVAEIFRSKALLTARRSRIRDWFDLYILMNQAGFTMADFHAAFAMAGIADQSDTGLQRLCSGKPPAGDEGFESLAQSAPRLEVIQEFFRAKRDEFERDEAARAFRDRHSQS